MKILDWLKSEETLKKEKRIEKEKEYKDRLCSMFTDIPFECVAYFNNSSKFEVVDNYIDNIIDELSKFLELLNSKLNDGVLYIRLFSDGYPFKLDVNYEFNEEYPNYSFIINYSIRKIKKNKEGMIVGYQSNISGLKSETNTIELEAILFINDKLVSALKENDSDRIEIARELLNISIKNMLNKNNK